MPVEIPSAAELLKWEKETKPALAKATQVLALDKLQRAAELGSSIAQEELLRREGLTGMGQDPLRLLRWPSEWGPMPVSPWSRPTALPSPIAGVQPQFLMSPKGWGFTEDFSTFISPAGEEFTLAEAQTELANMGFEALVYDYNLNLFVPSTFETVQAREAQYAQQRVNLGAIGQPGFVAPPGTPGAISPEEYQRRIADIGTMAGEQRQVLTDAFATVFPGQTIDDFFALVNDMVIDADAMSFDEVAEATELQIEFLETIRGVGRTPGTELLLQTVFPGIDETGMSELFGVPLGAQFFEEENWFKDFIIDPLYAGASSTVYGMVRTVSSVLPSLFMRQPLAQRLMPEQFQGIYEGQNQWLAGLQQGFETTFQKNIADEQAWLAAHPELTPKAEYQENPFEHPELFRDPGFYAYTISSTMAYSLSVMSTIVGVTAATGNPIVGLTAALGVAGAPEASNMTKELVSQGVPFEEAVQWGVLYGVFAGGVETVSDYPFLSVIFKPVKELMRPIWRAIFKNVANRIVKATIVGALIPTVEGFEEVVTEVAHNAILKYYDDSQSLLEGLDQSFITGVIASLPFAILGGGASYRSFREKLPDNVGSKIDKIAENLVATGLTEEQAVVSAVNEVARTPEGEKAIGEALEAIKKVAPEIVVSPIPEPVGAPAPNVKLNPVGETGERFEIVLGDDVVGELDVRETDPLGVRGNMLVDIEVFDRMRRKGIATQALDKILLAAEEKKRPLYSGLLKPDGEKWLRGLEERGVIKLTKQEQNLLGYLITRPEAVTPPVVKPISPPVVEPVAPTIPVTEPGEPEVGLQPSMLEEIPFKEVRPIGKGRVTQLSMDEQVKLEQMKRDAAEAEIPAVTSADEQQAHEHFEMQVELEGLREWVASEQASRLTNLIKKIGKRRGEISNLTLKQYRDIKGREHIPPSILTDDKKHVKWEFALDDIATEYGYESGEVLKEAIEKVGEAQERIAFLGNELSKVEAQPVVKTENLPTEGITSTALSNVQIANVMKLFKDALIGFGSEQQRASALELRKHIHAQRAAAAAVRAQELVIEGMDAEQAVKQAQGEFMTGKLPDVTTDYFEDLTTEMRNVLFGKGYNYWINKSWDELMSFNTALFNALSGESIPRKPGTGTKFFPKGGSAWDRLNRVFGDTPEILEVLDKKKPLRKVIETMYEFIYHDPVDLDPQMAAYLRGLSDTSLEASPFKELFKALEEPTGKEKLGETPYQPPSYEDVRAEAEKEFTATKLRLSTALSEKRLSKDMYDIELAQAKEKAYPYPKVIWGNRILDGVMREPSMIPLKQRAIMIRALQEAGLTTVDIGNFMRANLASFDFSWWRQQSPLIMGNLPQFWTGNIEAWKSIWSQESADASWKRITSHPLYELYEKMGQDFLRPLVFEKGSKQYQIVEEFGATGSERPIPKFTEHIPWVKVSQRVFVTGANEMNWAIFLKYYEAMTKVNELYATGKKKAKEGEAFSIENNMKDLSRMLSDMTGRASLGRFAAIAPIANALFFSMRLNLGRLLTPRHLISPNQFVRAEAWKNLSLFVGTLSSVILMGSFLDWWEVELDKRSADFMKIRIGNIRVDPWGGHLQFVVFFSRMYEKTGIVSTTGAEYTVDPISLGTYFLRTKGAPLANLILEFITGKTFFGDKLDITDISQWLEKVVPFALRDIYEAYTEQGMFGALIALPAIVGANVQAYKGDWEENVQKIGLPKYDDNVPYNIKDPIYDLLDFWADTASDFRGVDPATLTDSKGFTPLIRSVVEAYSLLTEINQMPNQRLTALNADPDEGLTYEDYYSQWQKRLELVASGDKEALKAFDADERTSHAYWGNFSKIQLFLLKEYHSLSPGDQAAFLKENLELYANPRDEWLRTNTKDNALLALFGKADIFSIAAYNEVYALAKSLDIPANAMVLKELDRITQLNLSYYEQNNLLDVYGGLDNTIEDENGETVRSRAIAQLKQDNPNWVDDMRRIEALRVGTDAVPTPTEFVDAWADRGHVIDEFGAGSIEAKLWLLDNKNAHQWALDTGLLTDDGSKWNEPILRLQAQWAPDFDKYDSYGDVKSDAYIADDEGRAKARRGLLFAVEISWQPGQLSEFGKAYYAKAASSAGYSEENWMRYTEFVVLPEWGSWRDRFLLEARSRDFYSEYITEGEGHSLVNESKIKPLIRDRTYGKFFDEFNQWDETGGMTEDEVKALHAKLDQVTRGEVSFREARYRVDAYDKYIEPAVIEDYVEWYTSPELDRPEGYTGDWYEDDWWLIDHKEFVDEMVGKELWQAKDFSNVPTREVFGLFQIYNSLPKGSARLDFRIENSDLDDWLIEAKGYKPATGTVDEVMKEQLTLDEQIATRLAEMGGGNQLLPVFRGGTPISTKSLSGLISSFRDASTDEEAYKFLDEAIGQFSQLEVKDSLSSTELAKWNWEIRASDWERDGLLFRLVSWGNEFYKVFEWLSRPEAVDKAQLSRIKKGVTGFNEIVINKLLPLYQSEPSDAFPLKTWNEVLRLAVKQYGVDELINRLQRDPPNQWDRIRKEILNIAKV